MNPAAGNASIGTYFVLSTGTGLVKIGRSQRIARRMEALQSAHGFPLLFIGWIPGDTEGEWHRKFRSSRRLGEWFDLDAEMMESVWAAVHSWTPPVQRLLDHPLMTAAEVAQQTGLSTWRVYDLAKQGMPCVRLGRAMRFDAHSVREWLLAGGTAP